MEDHATRPRAFAVARCAAPHGPPQSGGFTLVEAMLVLGIVAIVAGLTAVALSSLRGSLARRSMTGDLYSQLGVARARARARERSQIVVLFAGAGSPTTYGYFLFEESGTSTPTIFSAGQLLAVANSMTNPPAVSGYALTLLESRTSPSNGYYLSPDAWSGTPLPFPWSGLMTNAGKVNTSGGCTFCAGAKGALAFLPGGTAVFSDGNAVGGFVAIAGDTSAATGASVSGIAISRSGFFQLVEHP